MSLPYPSANGLSIFGISQAVKSPSEMSDLYENALSSLIQTCKNHFNKSNGAKVIVGTMFKTLSSVILTKRDVKEEVIKNSRW